MPSSYDKICQSFTKSAKWKDLNAMLRQELAKSGIIRFEFSDRMPSLDTENNERDRVEPRFIMSLGEHTAKRSIGFFTGSNFFFPTNDLLPSDLLNPIAESLFGTDGYPTYFCSKEKLIEGSKKGNSTTWVEFARSTILESNKDLVTQFEARVKAQFEALVVSPEYLRAKKQFFERLVIKEIKEVVLKYYEKVSPEVMKEALDEVVTHAIMES